MGDDNSFLRRPTAFDEDLRIEDSNIRRTEVNVADLFGDAPPSPRVDELLDDIGIGVVNRSATEEVVAASNSQETAPVQPTRNRFKFRRLKMIGHKELFLIETSLHLYSDYPTVWTMEGRIEQCPRLATGNKFRVQWNIRSSVPPVPPDFDESHLRSWYENNSEVKNSFINANQLCLSMNTAASTAQSRSRNAISVSTPSQVHRYQAVANMRTAGRVSTGSRNTARRVTRQSEEALESDSGSEGSRGDIQGDAWGEVDPDNPHNYYEDSDEELDEDVDRNSVAGSFVDLLMELEWNFEEVSQNEDLFTQCPDAAPKQLYDGPHGLQSGVAESFSNPAQCVDICGGLNYHFVATLAANSNDYFHRYKKPDLDDHNRWHGLTWRNITTEEMYHFLGIILKISLLNMDAGGYEAYFCGTEITLSTGIDMSAETIRIKDTRGWAFNYMSLRRFKQIRGTFHPEDKHASLGGDKCYQLRRAINQLNVASKNTFIPGRNLTFDEGGVACRSRLCPVRQYNKDKPDKFRVDFFVLSDARYYNIIHIDVYQGRNATNSYIDERCWTLPTTQKAVVNAVLQTGLDVPSHYGRRHIFLDNRYQCPELAVLLRERCNLYSTGTTRTNRKGWCKDILNLTKSNARGDMKLAFDSATLLIEAQWSDSKVINVTTSLIETGVDDVYNSLPR